MPEPKAEEPKAEDQPMADAGAGANAGAANPLYNLDAKKVAGVEYLEAATA